MTAKWLNNLQRLVDIKKKERATIERSIKLRAAHEAAVARRVIASRELALTKTPMDKLPEIVDKLARRRAEKRHAAKKSK